MQLEFKENEAIVLVLESPVLMRQYLDELAKQINGEEGLFVLSDKDKTLDIAKKVDLIFTPFGIDINEKRCLNKIYSQLKEIAYDEKNYVDTQQIFSSLSQYFIELEQELNVSLAYDSEIDFMQLVKAMGIKIEDYAEDMCESLGQYMTVVQHILNKKMFVFINLSSYLTKEEMEELLRQTFYQKINVLLIENREIHFDLDHKCYIIDSDKCEIY